MKTHHHKSDLPPDLRSYDFECPIDPQDAAKERRINEDIKAANREWRSEGGGNGNVVYTEGGWNE